jgi:hypothetical protein
MQDETKLNEIELAMLDQDVIALHNIARHLEQVFGQPGQLSDDIRRAADRLTTLLQRV